MVADHQKMSKSRGNVVAPDEYVRDIGADAVRCYLDVPGSVGSGRRVERHGDQRGRPLDEPGVGACRAGCPGARRLSRRRRRGPRPGQDRSQDDPARDRRHGALQVQHLRGGADGVHQLAEPSLGSARASHPIGGARRSRSCCCCWRPMAPHVSEELWERTGHKYSVHSQRLPEWDPELAADQVVTLVVQVNGKLRDRIDVSPSIGEEEARALADGERASPAPHRGQADRERSSTSPGSWSIWWCGPVVGKTDSYEDHEEVTCERPLASLAGTPGHAGSWDRFETLHGAIRTGPQAEGFHSGTVLGHAAAPVENRGWGAVHQGSPRRPRVRESPESGFGQLDFVSHSVSLCTTGSVRRENGKNRPLGRSSSVMIARVFCSVKGRVLRTFAPRLPGRGP